jgi:O-antigen ligase
MATAVAIVVLLLRGDDVVRVSHSLMKGFIWSSCLLAMIAWGMPAEVDLRLGDLEFFNTNQIGNLCAIGIFFAQYLASRRDGKWKIGLLLLSLTLLRSMSKATISAFIVSQCILLLGNRLVKGSMKILIAGASVAAMLLFWGLFQAYYDIYSSTGNQAETLTGRTTIWAFTLDAALEKPWTGNGIDAMWKVFPPFGNELFEARHAENELLQQFFSYGIAGVAMLFGLYGSLYRQTRKKPKDGSRDVLRCLMLFIVLRGLVEAEPIDLLLPLWMITMLGAIVADSPAVQSQSQAGEIANPALLRRLGQAGSVLL